MNISLFIFLLFTLQIIYWFVGRSSSKKVQNREDYFLAGKNVKFFPLMMTFLATQVGGGIILGSAEEAYLFGWGSLFYPLGAALGLILLGCGVGSKLAKLPITTVAQIFDLHYKSPLLKKVASLLSITSLFMILVAQIIASHKFLLALGFTSLPLFILFWMIVIIYTAQGGLKAVISTDIIQATFFSIIFLFALGFVFFAIPHASLATFGSGASLAPISTKLTGWLLMPLLFMFIEQDMGQRCFAGSSSKVVSKASLVAGIVTLIVCVVPVFFGNLAHHMGLIIPKGASVLMTTIAATTNPWISALVGCAVLAAIVSTATSLINAISSNLSQDFKTQERIGGAKIMTTLISITAIFFSFYFTNIVDLLIQSYELSVSSLFVPIFFALFRKENSILAAWFAILAGAAGFFFLTPGSTIIPKEILSLLFSLIGYGVGSLILKQKGTRSEPRRL